MIYRASFFCGLLISVLTGYSYDSLDLVERADSLFIIHEVENGETVYSLAKRYHTTVNNLILQNSLKNSNLNIGQLLEIHFKKEALDNSSIFSEPLNGQHEVLLGETMYSIAKKYNLSLEALRKMNPYTANELSVGQNLIISESFKKQNTKKILIPVPKKEKIIFESFSDSISFAKTDSEDELKPYIYYVQNGEDIEEIAAKFNTTKEQIKEYNNLKSNRIKAGQKINFPDALINDSTIIRISTVPDYISTEYGSKLLLTEIGGVKKHIEEGLVLKIDSELNTPKYLALHRSLSIGTIFEVINLMNNKNVYVRVVGRLPKTGLNQKVMLRLTGSVFKHLGIVDQQARMKIIYYK